MPPCARVPRSRSPSDKRASLSQLRASIPPRIPSFDANRKLFREKIWKRDPRRRWNRVRSDRLSVSLLKTALPPSLSLSHFFSFSSELESERFLVENRRRLERVRLVSRNRKSARANRAIDLFLRARNRSVMIRR